MDIKNSKDNYNTTIAKDMSLIEIEKSVEYIMHCGIDYEFRTTLVLGYHTEKSMKEIGKWIRGAKKYYLQKFVDSGNCLQNNLEAISKEDATKFVDILADYIDNVNLRGY